MQRLKAKGASHKTHPKLESGIVGEALECLVRVTDIDPLHRRWIEHALLRQATGNALTTTKHTLRTRRLRRAAPQASRRGCRRRPPVALHTNVGVLGYMLSRYEEALRATASAQKIASRHSGELSEAEAAKVRNALAYNSARMKERMGRREEAAADYEAT